MTTFKQDKIIEMAKEAGLSNPLWIENDYEIIETFASLVAQKVRDRIMFGSRDDWVLAEREACAKVADEYAQQVLEHNFSKLIAHNIRARGEQA